MVEAIVGLKGSGKTSLLVDEINRHAGDGSENLICIEHGRRMDRVIPYQVRLIDITEYPVCGYDQLLSFLAGMNAKDYDISHIYIDSIFKIANDSNLDNLGEFMKKLDILTKELDFAVTITISVDPDELPDSVKAYVRPDADAKD